jgi:hypothetical protein
MTRVKDTAEDVQAESTMKRLGEGVTNSHDIVAHLTNEPLVADNHFVRWPGLGPTTSEIDVGLSIAGSYQEQRRFRSSPAMTKVDDPPRLEDSSGVRR